MTHLHVSCAIPAAFITAFLRTNDRTVYDKVLSSPVLCMAKGAAWLQRMPPSMDTAKVCSTSGRPAYEVLRERVVLKTTPNGVATEMYRLNTLQGGLSELLSSLHDMDVANGLYSNVPAGAGKARLQCLIIPGNPGDHLRLIDTQKLACCCCRRVVQWTQGCWISF